MGISHPNRNKAFSKYAICQHFHTNLFHNFLSGKLQICFVTFFKSIKRWKITNLFFSVAFFKSMKKWKITNLFCNTHRYINLTKMDQIWILGWVASKNVLNVYATLREQAYDKFLNHFDIKNHFDNWIYKLSFSYLKSEGDIHSPDLPVNTIFWT